MFIHGGYWYSLDKSHYSYVAEGVRPHGFATAVTNFGLAPAHDMDEIVRQNREAMAWLWRHAAAHGGDPERIYVAGTFRRRASGGDAAGDRLAGFAPGPAARVVKGACAIGGNLRPGTDPAVVPRTKSYI